MQTVRSKCKVNKSDNLVQSRPKRDIKPPSQVGFIVNLKIILKKTWIIIDKIRLYTSVHAIEGKMLTTLCIHVFFKCFLM